MQSRENIIENRWRAYLCAVVGGDSKTLIRNGLLHNDGLDTCWRPVFKCWLYIIIFTTLLAFGSLVCSIYW